jgi:hypothetical protein
MTAESAWLNRHSYFLTPVIAHTDLPLQPSACLVGDPGLGSGEDGKSTGAGVQDGKLGKTVGKLGKQRDLWCPRLGLRCSPALCRGGLGDAQNDARRLMAAQVPSGALCLPRASPGAGSDRASACGATAEVSGTAPACPKCIRRLVSSPGLLARRSQDTIGAGIARFTMVTPFARGQPNPRGSHRTAPKVPRGRAGGREGVSEVQVAHRR